MKPVAEEKFNIGDTDMTSQLLRAKEAGADVVLTYGDRAGAGADRQRHGQAGLEGAAGRQLDAVAWPRFIDTAGANGNGAMMPQTFIQLPNTPKRAAFIKAYQDAYKIDRMPSPVSAAQGYDSVYLLAAAIKQAESTDGRKIRDALENLNEKVEGVVTVYDHPFSKTDHEAITANIPVFGEVKDGRVRAGACRGRRGRQGRAHQAARA